MKEVQKKKNFHIFSLLSAETVINPGEINVWG